MAEVAEVAEEVAEEEVAEVAAVKAAVAETVIRAMEELAAVAVDVAFPLPAAVTAPSFAV